MGCNAWNHHHGCNCGWGGDTGGGGRYRAPAPAPVNVWTSPRYRDLESYVNPNATCPVCGAAVFFYQSPYGGRVFFDEFGPPWPKHPCTDSDSGLGLGAQHIPAPARDSERSAVAEPVPRAPRDSWAPLVVQRMVPAGSVDLILTEKKHNTLGKAVIPVQGSSLRNRPLFWRRNPNDPSLIQIASFTDSSNGIQAIEVSAPCWISTEAEAQNYQKGAPPSAKDWNSIGWAASFAHRVKDAGDWSTSCSVDWEWAKLAFEKGEEAGFWPSINNLAVMYREGYGVQVDLELAFAKFQLAAQSLEPIPLRHLAKCYRVGFGVEADDMEASYLEELAELQELERGAKH